MRDDPRLIGDRIRERRRALGLSQRDLSQPGISDAYISRIESGQRRPSLKVLRKLAPKLETTTHWLETGDLLPEAMAAWMPLRLRRSCGWAVRRLFRP